MTINAIHCLDDCGSFVLLFLSKKERKQSLKDLSNKRKNKRGKKKKTIDK